MAYYTSQSAGVEILTAEELLYRGEPNWSFEDTDDQWAHENELNQRQRKENLMDAKDNRVTLWQNETDNPKAPVYKGKGLVNGKEVECGMWKNTSKAGTTYLSLNFSEPYAKETSVASDVPF